MTPCTKQPFSFTFLQHGGHGAPWLPWLVFMPSNVDPSLESLGVVDPTLLYMVYKLHDIQHIWFTLYGFLLYYIWFVSCCIMMYHVVSTINQSGFSATFLIVPEWIQIGWVTPAETTFHEPNLCFHEVLLHVDFPCKSHICIYIYTYI